jgi:ribosome-associated protein
MAKSTLKTPTTEASEELANWVVKGMQEKKAQEIVVMDLREVHNAFTDFFVVCSGTSDTQIEAIADSVDKEVWESGKIHVHAVEGKANREWILMDYYDVIVHVFLKDKREFFKLEELWGDAKFTYIPEA